MRWRIPVLAMAIIASACGEPAADQLLTTSQTLPPVTTATTAITTIVSTTTTVPTTTTNPTPVDDTVQEVMGDEVLTEELLEQLLEVGFQVGTPVLLPGQAIERPAGFPSVEELVSLSDYASTGAGHRRAEITSYAGPSGTAAEMVAAGFEVQMAIGTKLTITFLDSVIVWDTGEFGRFVLVDNEYLGLGPDGEWHSSGGFDWGLIWSPMIDQEAVQRGAGTVLAAVGQEVAGYDVTEVVGYELLGETETIRVRGTGNLYSEVWIRADGAVMRLVHFLGPVDSVGMVSWVWNVETLDPELTGPLPPGA